MSCGELLWSRYSSKNEEKQNVIVDVHPTKFTHLLYVFYIPSVSPVVHFGIDTKDEFLEKQELSFLRNGNEDIDLKLLNLQNLDIQQNHMNLALNIFTASSAL